ncbi:MAG: PKD domain-containing protein, partial [Ignavibacteriae bacterium]|nr:PKD domain-containing protein [Ignavibacteriota bacterium]
LRAFLEIKKIILDYKTGDSIRSFPKPKEMYGTDIVLGKNGERLYILTQNGYLRSWDILSGDKLSDILMDATTIKGNNSGYSYQSLSYVMDNSLDGKYIAVLTSCSFIVRADDGSNDDVFVFKTVDSSYIKPYSVSKKDDSYNVSRDKKLGEILSKTANLNFSPSGNYLLNNTSSSYHYHSGGGGGDYYSSTSDANISSFSPNLKSYRNSGHWPYLIISSDDDFLLSGNNLMEIPPSHIFRTINKTGFVFLPDDNHMLAFNSGDGVAAISNIENDSWEKVYTGDTIVENIIQTNASRSAFATASNNRITLWKIPDTLKAATLNANFIMSNNENQIIDSIQVFDTVVFTNKTFPFKRGSHFEWNFGDGKETTIEYNPIHKFTQAGVFTITLKVLDTLGRTNSISKKIVVNFPVPQAGFTTPNDTVFVGNILNFTNTTTPIRSGTLFTWNFDDGVITNVTNPHHQFFQTGIFKVKLIVKDTLGRLDSITRKIVVINQIVPEGATWINHFHYQRINSLSFSSDGKNVISGCEDGYSRILETKVGTQEFSKNLSQPVFSVNFAKDSKTGIVASYQITNNSPIYIKNSVAKFNSYLDVWDWSQDSLERKVNWSIQTSESLIATYQYFANTSLCTSFSEDNNWYIIGTQFHTAYSSFVGNPRVDIDDFRNKILYNFSTGKSRNFNPNLESAYHNGFSAYALGTNFFTLISPDNRFYLLLEKQNSSQPLSIVVRDIITDSILRSIPNQCNSMRFSPDKYHVLTNTGLFDVVESFCVQKVELPSIFEYHPDGIHIFALRPDSTIGIFSLNTNSWEYIYPKQPTVFTALAVALDGKHIVTGDKYGYITFWKVPDSLKVAIKTDFNTMLFKGNNLKTTDTVVFANNTLPANNTFDFLWNFGDGTTSNERTPTHKFTNAGTYTITLTTLQNGKVIDSMKKYSYIIIKDVLSAEEPKSELELSFSITPNPSYGEINLKYTLAQSSNIKIRITDILGREVKYWSLQVQSGEHSLLWNGNIGVGVYYCTFNTGNIVTTIPYIVTQ